MHPQPTCCISGAMRCRIAAWNMSLEASSESPSLPESSSSFSRYSATITPVAPIDSATALRKVPEQSCTERVKKGVSVELAALDETKRAHSNP